MAQPFVLSYQDGAAEFARTMFGRDLTAEEIGFLAGALDGAEVIVSRRKVGLYLEVNDPARFATYETSIRRDFDSSLWAYIHDVRTAAGLRGHGFGIRAFMRQVQAAQALGLTRFELWAAGHPGDQTHNGWLTWPKFGFDALLTQRDIRLLAPNVAFAQTVNDLMEGEGKDWWIVNGTERSMVFDLSPSSSMMRQLRRYLKSKGLFL